VRSRVFLKLLAAFLLVIAVTTATLDFSIRRGWEKWLRSAQLQPAPEQATAEIRRSIVLSSGVAVLTALALAAILAQAVARRLRRMLGFAEGIAAGNLSARIRDGSSDEIAQLASALDATAGKLEDSFAELESSRARLETLLDSIQDAVLAISAEGKVQWANRSLRRLLSQIRTGGAVVETIRDPGLVGALQDCLAAGEVRTARATAVVPGRIFEVTAAPLSEGGAVVVLHDLTEVERVDKTRRDFIANVSHELRTPLTSIQGYTETLLDASAANGNTREFLEIIRKNANRMARLTEDLLTLARVESGELKLEFQPVPADELLESARQSFRAVAKARGIELVVEETTATMVRADKDAVHQVFANLIDNAVKYAPSGTTILLGARLHPSPPEAGADRAVPPGGTGAPGPPAETVEFYVRDFGPGIPSEHLPRLFERFYRVDTARSREAGGTGLGLAIVKHVVLNHGGRVRVESELRHGSTFIFTLPVASVEAPAGV